MARASAEKIDELFGTRLMKIRVPHTAAAATDGPSFEPSVNSRLQMQ